MKSTKVVVVVAASAVGITLAVSGVRAMQSPASPAESVAAPELIHWGGRRWGRDGGARAYERVCSAERDERLADAIDFVENFANFTPQQIEAWEGLVAALQRGSDTVGDACNDIQPLDEQATAPERLAQVELVTSTGLEILRDVRPAFDDLYAVLNEDQKESLNNLMNRRRR